MWCILIFSIFTKCGLAPFFFWKPTFFKGLTFTSIFYYICIFYFSLFLFFINFITNNFHFIFYFFHNIFILLVIVGLFMVLFLVLEAFYLKTFLAISSILNSLMLFTTAKYRLLPYKTRAKSLTWELDIARNSINEFKILLIAKNVFR
jgi:hypothetical protein